MNAPAPPRAPDAAHLLLLLPGALVVLFSFQAGGFFPGVTALVAAGLVLALVLHITIAPRPFRGLSGAWAAGAVFLALFAVWTLISGAWSHAPARAVIEYDRVLLYLLTFVVFGALGRTPQRLRWLLRGLAVGVAVVCACSLITRLAPDVWRVESSIAPDRLSYPLTYWNALGLLAALGAIFCFGLSADGREPRACRVLAAAAVPMLCTTVVLSFSRGAIVAGIVGLLLVVLVARPSALLGGVLAAVPAVIVVKVALAADLVGSADPTIAAAAAQGHEVALILAACTAAAAAVRLVAMSVDASLARLRVPGLPRRRGVTAAAALATVVVAMAFAVLGGPAAVGRQVDAFAQGNVVTGSRQQRLTQLGNNGRIDSWRVALDAFGDQRLRGEGAGTWALRWHLERPNALQVNDAHSLYLEVLAELGVVGLALLVGALLTILGGLAAGARGPERGPSGVLCAAGLAWMLHAAVDWDWEMPAVTVWLFAAGGLALASPPSPARATTGGSRLPAGTGRVLAGLTCLVLLLVPLSVVRSQHPLRDAQRAYARGDCPAAIDRALASSAALGSRPEPYYIVGLCDARAGYGDLAVRALEKAVARDPRNWEYRYGLALVRGANRLDPRPAARAALRLNPREALAATAVRRFATTRPEQWRRRALTSRLPSE